MSFGLLVFTSAETGQLTHRRFHLIYHFLHSFFIDVLVTFRKFHPSFKVFNYFPPPSMSEMEGCKVSCTWVNLAA